MSPLLIAALQLFNRAYPKIKVEITFATSEELLKQLDGSGLDFVLSFKPEDLTDDFETIPLFSSRHSSLFTVLILWQAYLPLR